MGFFRQEFWSGLTFPPPGDLPNPGIEPGSLMSPALAGRLFITEPPGEPKEPKRHNRKIPHVATKACHSQINKFFFLKYIEVLTLVPVNVTSLGTTVSADVIKFQGGHCIKSAMRETKVRSLDRDDPLEKGMATHSSIVAWRIPWTEEPGRLQSRGLKRVGYNWVTNTFTFSNPTRQGLFLEEIWTQSMQRRRMM